MTADFEAIRDRNAVTFTYSSNSFSGVEEEREESDDTLNAGFIREYQYGIYCLLADFTDVPVTVPNIGSDFTSLNGGSYQVVKRRYMPDQITILFGLDTINK